MSMIPPKTLRGKPRKGGLRGQLPHEPTEQTKKQVEALAGYGLTHDEIGHVIGVSPPTLRRHYRTALDCGMSKADAMVLESLFRQAIGRGTKVSAACAIFWAKCRRGWRENQQNGESVEGNREIVLRIKAGVDGEEIEVGPPPRKTKP